MGIGPGKTGPRGEITIVAVSSLSITESVRNTISKRIAAGKTTMLMNVDGVCNTYGLHLQYIQLQEMDQLLEQDY